MKEAIKRPEGDIVDIFKTVLSQHSAEKEEEAKARAESWKSRCKIITAFASPAFIFALLEFLKFITKG